jgi:hypothetical protein
MPSNVVPPPPKQRDHLPWMPARTNGSTGGLRGSIYPVFPEPRQVPQVLRPPPPQVPQRRASVRPERPVPLQVPHVTVPTPPQVPQFATDHSPL